MYSYSMTFDSFRYLLVKTSEIKVPINPWKKLTIAKAINIFPSVNGETNVTQVNRAIIASKLDAIWDAIYFLDDWIFIKKINKVFIK